MHRTKLRIYTVTLEHTPKPIEHDGKIKQPQMYRRDERVLSTDLQRAIDIVKNARPDDRIVEAVEHLEVDLLDLKILDRCHDELEGRLVGKC